MAPQAVMMTGASPRVSLVAYESWRITDPKGACPHSGEDAALEVASLAPSASRGKSGDFCYQEGSPGFGSGPDPETSQSIPMLLADYSIESRHGASFVSWPIRYLSPTLPPPPQTPISKTLVSTTNCNHHRNHGRRHRIQARPCRRHAGRLRRHRHDIPLKLHR